MRASEPERAPIYPKRALIAMSGGVDSSVAAALTREAGYDCVGVTMKLYNNEDVGLPRAHTCCSLDDVLDARSVAGKLGMPFYVLNFTDGFKENVIDRFVAAYLDGRTPNPCIDCNRYMKFDRLFVRAQELGLSYVVTGHYARISQDGSGRYLLRKAADLSKDQSYVLYSLTQQQLAHTLFPLGSLHKTEVREIARAHGFDNAAKHDSQDICFVQSGRYADFIEQYTGLPSRPGDFIDRDGHILGRHKGIIHYTIGQHKGLGIPFPQPMYVCKIDPAANTVTLGTQEQLYTRELQVGGVNLIAADRLDGTVRLKAKIRYRQTEQWADVTQDGEDQLRVVFDEPQRAVTRGQAVVLYDGDLVVGGGTIL